MERRKYRDLLGEVITLWATDFTRRFRISVKLFSIRVSIYALDILLSYSVFIRDPVYFAEHEVNPFAVGTLRGEPFSIIGFLGLFFVYLSLFVYVVSYSKEATQKYQRYSLTAFVIIVLVNGLIAPLGWFWPHLTLVWAILYRVELLLLFLGIILGSSKKRSQEINKTSPEGRFRKLIRPFFIYISTKQVLTSSTRGSRRPESFSRA